jgi:DNA replication and repair protein RecF
MVVSVLEIGNFRNLRKAVLQCSPKLNIIVGGNASGKTSLLEALYFLGRVRSFRTRRIGELIHYDETAFQIVATVSNCKDGRFFPVGIRRSIQELNARVDGMPVRSLAELATQVPVLLLNPGSHRLLEGGPQQRRRFMDWGLFHTTDVFIGLWRRYKSVLRNRNAALRQGFSNRMMEAWDHELVSASVALDEHRKTFCEALEGALKPFLASTLGTDSLQIIYHRGWPLGQDQDLLQLLQDGLDQDRRYGHTRLGAHRADFQIKLSGRPAPEYLSRGQQKLLVIALILAQADLFQKQRCKPCTLLIDDLPAELDVVHRNQVMKCLATLDSQLFITAIEADMLNTAEWADTCRFEICGGEVRKMV